MSCPPGTVLNPRTLRCVRVTGRKAQELVRQGNIADYFGRPQVYQQYRQRRRTYKAPRAHSIYGPIQAANPLPVACPPGSQRNPSTGRCIRVGGKTYKRMYRPQQQQQQVPLYQQQQQQQPQPLFPPRVRLNQNQIRRRTSSNGPLKLPVGTASVAPLVDRPSLNAWIAENCRNDKDPLTSTPFATVDTPTLQDVVRLHDRTCTFPVPLNAAVEQQHKKGNVATIPGDPNSNMTLDDFTALRNSMRRRNPKYKIPGRKHQPPPPNWKLYVASDNRSGPDFASVMFVDVTKVVQTAAGVQYPVESVVLDLGFIPLTITGALCSARTVVDLLQQLTGANRLLTPVAGGWKPVAGFPFRRSYWSAPDATERFNRLCRDLTKALANPM